MPFSLNREKRYSLKQQKSAKTIAGGEAGGQIIGFTILQHLPTLQGNIDFRQDIQDYVVIEWRIGKSFFVGKEPTRDLKWSSFEQIST